MEAATVQAHPDRGDAALVSFSQRYQAEQFWKAAFKEIPHVGKCELSWVTNSAVQKAAGNDTGDVLMDAGAEPSPTGQRADVDYDVADDDDRWLVD